MRASMLSWLSDRRLSNRRQSAMTLLEVLITIAIAALLVQLGVAAILSARESSRRAQCLNHLRQLSLGVQGHLSAREHFPAGGWSWEWVGDPHRGWDEKQPGGWLYNLLPFIEHQAIHDHALAFREPPDLHQKLAEMESMAIPLLHCPSRRTSRSYPRDWAQPTRNSHPTRQHARTDYAANGGDVYVNLGPGPRDYQQADQPDYDWTKGNNIAQATGIVFPRSRTRTSDVLDGLSKTYLVGEKYLNPKNYSNGRDDGDDFSIYQGDDMDISRWTRPTVNDYFKGLIDHPNQPRRDNKNFYTAYAFGSAHATGWNATFCDGSARLMHYQLDPVLHQQLGNSRDQRLMEVIP